MPKKIKSIPTLITKADVDSFTRKYHEDLRNIPLHFSESNLLDFLNKLKRKKMSCGRYPNVSLFEAANRIMSDLVILGGLKMLFNNQIPYLPTLEQYNVDFGHSNTQKHDIIGRDENFYFAAEAFNVSESFYNGKKSYTVRKFRNAEPKPSHSVIFCNADIHEGRDLDLYNENPIRVIPVTIAF